MHISNFKASKREQDFLLDKVEDLERKLDKETLQRKRAEELLEGNIADHEIEVQLRLRFEEKLNLVHIHQRKVDILLAKAVK